jgi:hypothetical protein
MTQTSYHWQLREHKVGIRLNRSLPLGAVVMSAHCIAIALGRTSDLYLLETSNNVVVSGPLAEHA